MKGVKKAELLENGPSENGISVVSNERRENIQTKKDMGEPNCLAGCPFSSGHPDVSAAQGYHCKLLPPNGPIPCFPSRGLRRLLHIASSTSKGLVKPLEG